MAFPEKMGATEYQVYLKYYLTHLNYYFQLWIHFWIVSINLPMTSNRFKHLFGKTNQKLVETFQKCLKIRLPSVQAWMLPLSCRLHCWQNMDKTLVCIALIISFVLYSLNVTETSLEQVRTEKMASMVKMVSGNNFQYKMAMNNINRFHRFHRFHGILPHCWLYMWFLCIFSYIYIYTINQGK